MKCRYVQSLRTIFIRVWECGNTQGGREREREKDLCTVHCTYNEYIMCIALIN